MTTTLAVERLSDLMLLSDDWVRFTELNCEHAKEVFNFKFNRLVKWKPDYKKYQQIEREGRLHLVVMRQGGEIVGYATHQIVDGHHEFGPLTIAKEHNIYLVPRLRGTGEHMRMRVFVLSGLKDRGVQLVQATTKFGHDHRTSLTALGFEPVDIVYVCDLTSFQVPESGCR